MDEAWARKAHCFARVVRSENNLKQLNGGVDASLICSLDQALDARIHPVANSSAVGASSLRLTYSFRVPSC